MENKSLISFDDNKVKTLNKLSIADDLQALRDYLTDNYEDMPARNDTLLLGWLKTLSTASDMITSNIKED